MTDAAIPSQESASAAAPTPPRSDRELLWGGLLAFAISRIYIAFFLAPEISDVTLYYNAAATIVDLDKVPYREVAVGYPPAALWLMLAPRLVDPQEIVPGHVKEAYARYYTLFRVELLILDFASLALLMGAIARWRPQMLVAAVWAWTLVSLLLAYVLYDRTDVAIWFCVTLWAFAWSRRASERGFDGWTALAAAAVGLGIAVKVVTGVMAPFLVLGAWYPRRRIADAAAAAAIIVLVAALPFAVHLPSAGSDVFQSLERHGGRSIQLESTYATMIMLFRPLGVDMKPVYEVNAWSLESSLTLWFRALATICLYGGLLAAMIWAWTQRRRFDDRRSFDASGLALAGLLVVAHVLSPQYFLWGLGVLLIVGTELSPRAYLAVACLSLAIAGLTTFVFPFHLENSYTLGGRVIPQPYNLVRDFHWIPCAALVVRNALYVGLVAWVAHRLLRPASAAAR